jgi:hypothetical protein
MSDLTFSEASIEHIMPPLLFFALFLCEVIDDGQLQSQISVCASKLNKFDNPRHGHANPFFLLD